MQNLSVLHLILVNVPYCSLVVLVSNGNGNGSRVVVRVADMAVVLPLLFSSLFFFFVLICVNILFRGSDKRVIFRLSRAEAFS